MAKKRDVLKMRSLRMSGKQEVKEEKEYEPLSETIDAPTKEQEAREVEALYQAIAEVDKEMEAARKAEVAAIAKETPVAKQAQKLTSQADDLQKQLEHAAEVIARKQAELNQLRKKAAEAEAEAEAEAIAKVEEEAKAKKAEAEAEAKRAAEAAKQREAIAARRADAQIPRPANTGKTGPAKVYECWDYVSQKTIRLSDPYAAEQATPGAWKIVWVWYENGKIDHVLTPAELAEYLPA